MGYFLRFFLKGIHWFFGFLPWFLPDASLHGICIIRVIRIRFVQEIVEEALGDVENPEGGRSESIDIQLTFKCNI